MPAEARDGAVDVGVELQDLREARSARAPGARRGCTAGEPEVAAALPRLLHGLEQGAQTGAARVVHAARSRRRGACSPPSICSRNAATSGRRSRRPRFRRSASTVAWERLLDRCPWFRSGRSLASCLTSVRRFPPRGCGLVLVPRPPRGGSGASRAHRPRGRSQPAERSGADAAAGSKARPRSTIVTTTSSPSFAKRTRSARGSRPA